MTNLVLKYIGGLAIGAAVIGGYAGVRHMARDEPTVLPSRETVEALPEPDDIAPVEPQQLAEQPYEEPAEELSNVPQVCRDYFRVMDHLAECKEVPEAVRESMRDAIRSTRDAFRSMTDVPDTSLDAMVQGCQTAVAAIRDTGKSLGCQL